MQSLLTRFLGTKSTPLAGALRAAEERGIEIPGSLIRAHLLAGGDVEPVLEAMILAQDRGLPAPFALLAEAQLEGLDLRAFVERGCKDPELKTLSALRAAAPTNPEAATRLAGRLLDAIKDLEAKRAQGPSWLGERLVWKGVDRRLQAAQHTVAEELRGLIPYLPPDAAGKLRNDLERAV